MELKSPIRVEEIEQILAKHKCILDIPTSADKGKIIKDLETRIAKLEAKELKEPVKDSSKLTKTSGIPAS